MGEITPVELAPDSARLGTSTGDPLHVPTSAVFIFIGGELPTRFLKDCGVEIEAHFGSRR